MQIPKGAEFRFCSDEFAGGNQALRRSCEVPFVGCRYSPGPPRRLNA